jgi:thiamine-phosphate pyrophosphorylase
MTDARIADMLPSIAARMPPRSAIVIRAFALPAQNRVGLCRTLRRIAGARRHLLIWSGATRPAGFSGRHGDRRRPGDHVLIMPVHNQREAAAARRHCADIALVSPIHATRSHQGAATLKPQGFRRLAAATGRPCVALGGMDPVRFQQLRTHGARGWAAIDAWLAMEN